jgi:hypothetical protein
MEAYYAVVVLTLWALIAQVGGNRRVERMVLAAAAGTIALIAGLRWYSDIDFEPYAQMYSDNPALSELSRESVSRLYGEAGFLALTAVFKTLGSEFVLLAFACALTSLLLKSVSLFRLSKHASLALCLYLCLHFVTIEFIQMRWAVASAWLALGFSFQYLRKFKAAFLCFALALAFHYFSAVFWIVALLVTMKGHRRFYVMLAVSLLAALLLKLEHVAGFLVSDSSVYVLERINRYATNPNAPLGVLSFAKLLMYPAIYAACVWFRPAYAWKEDGLNMFLFKLSSVLISLTLAVTFIPILHQRASVLADFFALIWILNALHCALSAGARSFAFAGLGALYCAWYVVDVSNYVNAGRLFPYQTWLTRLP